MSAYVVDKATIDEIVQGLKQYGLCDLDNEAGQLLWDENVKSVNYRYDDIPAYDAVVYRYQPRPTTAGQLARSITNYVYQACESPSWPTSEARDLCVRLALDLLDQVPGYREAVAR